MVTIFRWSMYIVVCMSFFFLISLLAEKFTLHQENYVPTFSPHEAIWVLCNWAEMGARSQHDLETVAHTMDMWLLQMPRAFPVGKKTHSTDVVQALYRPSAFSPFSPSIALPQALSPNPSTLEVDAELACHARQNVFMLQTQGLYIHYLATMLLT